MMMIPFLPSVNQRLFRNGVLILAAALPFVNFKKSFVKLNAIQNETATAMLLQLAGTVDYEDPDYFTSEDHEFASSVITITHDHNEEEEDGGLTAESTITSTTSTSTTTTKEAKIRNSNIAEKDTDTKATERKMEGNSNNDIDDKDKDCIFRNSPIYRKVYVYPNWGEPDYTGDILSDAGRSGTSLKWPWLEYDRSARNETRGFYNPSNPSQQYTTEIMIRELMTNPNSCLLTDNPEEATLFYVPYLPAVEHCKADSKVKFFDDKQSPFAQAIIDIVDKQSYGGWERTFGLTSKWWKRRKGSDHILVFSEPLHGLSHPRMKRGNFHFVKTQKQLTPPIVISVELSATFIEMYPNCAAKNILVPYPNVDGAWFNGKYAKQAQQRIMTSKYRTTGTFPSALPNEEKNSIGRPIAQFYKAGEHGSCKKLRIAMRQDYSNCASSRNMLKELDVASNYAVGMHLSTFCPCPGGDSPSAKRHSDAIIGGCIPIILSKDFVWPFTKDFDSNVELDANTFSIRLNASDYDEPLLDPNTCKPLHSSASSANKNQGLQAYLESIPLEEIQRLRKGLEHAKDIYTWYKATGTEDSFPANPIKDGKLPNGGLAHMVVKMLGERASGAKWPACEAELKLPRKLHQPKFFKC